MKYVFECQRCGDQADPDNVLGLCNGKSNHLWKAYAHDDGEVWKDKNGDPITEYFFEMKRNIEK